MYKQAAFGQRHLFAVLLNKERLCGNAIEIGTHMGVFAADFMAKWRGQRLFCVDPWEKQPPEFLPQVACLPGGTVLEGAGTEKRDRKKDRLTAEKNLFAHLDRVQFYVGTSAEFATEGLCEDNAPYDFVYIDGDHYQVVDDLNRWWPFIRPGGIIAGHDWLLPSVDEGADCWGRFIQPDVEKFSNRLGVDVWLVIEEDGSPWSYYMRKP